jgi:hypothetical protein
MSKYKLYIIFLLVISICSFNFLNIKASNLPLVGKVIYLDAGHP